VRVGLPLAWALNMSGYPPDWSRPWWRDWQPWIEPGWAEWHQQTLQHVDDTAGLPAVLNRFSQAAPVQFVPQAALPDGQSYEGFIFEHRQVPTRDNLHDFFNACCWQRFPKTKLKLNALQAEVIGRDGVGSTRGPLRDALTLFDENALLLQAPHALWQALQRHDWNTLLVTHRQDWLASGRVRPVVLGHALLEKLCQPYKSITAHAFWIDPQVPASTLAWDAWLAERLTAPFMATKPFQPLPVMGIPGWCADNADAAFYDDQQVFRPLPTRR
jgi:hypothetical protein